MNRADFQAIIDGALREDLAGVGDITSENVVPADLAARGELVARQDGVVAGIGVAEAVFDTVDPELSFTAQVADGDWVVIGTVLAVIEGRARSLLVGERTALNLISRMSGVATATRRLVDQVAGYPARITDTRKTMPGLRVLDKYAVVVGGGINHRMGLYDAVLIKDNHIAAAGDLRAAVAAARRAVGDQVMVEVEVDTLEQLAEVLETDADRVLLDNMSPVMLRQAVEMVAGRIVTEASGGVTLDTVRTIASTGVDIISTGWITHSAPQLDIALDF